MSLDSNSQLKFSDHYNSKWMLENCKAVSTSTELDALYSRLISNKELVINVPHTIHLKGPIIPDFEADCLATEEHEHLVNALIASQTSLAEIVVSSSPFAQNLKKRLVVLQRIYHATSKQCHIPTVDITENFSSSDNVAWSTQDDNDPKSGNTVLVELGVETGLSLVFALLEQNWQQSVLIGVPSLCDSILSTAINVLVSLKPLSLANESKLTYLGVHALNRTFSFLKSICSSNSETHISARPLASELMITLAAQRGSLKYVLEWVELAVLSLSRLEGANKIRWSLFHDVISKMMKTAGFSALKTNTGADPQCDENGLVPSHLAAVYLLEQLHGLAEDYCLTHLQLLPSSTDSQQANPTPSRSSGISSTQSSVAMDTCDVYIWGSNSTHQLAEGTTERILTPKLSSNFRDSPVVSSFKPNWLGFHFSAY